MALYVPQAAVGMNAPLYHAPLNRATQHPSYLQAIETRLFAEIAARDLADLPIPVRKVSLFPPNFGLSSIDSSKGMEFIGPVPNGNAGSTIGSIGDINGDGKTDLYIGSWGNSYVVFGGKNLDGPLLLGQLDGTNGFQITGPFGQATVSIPIQAAGDVNGDGIGDSIIGSHGSFPGQPTHQGAVFLLFGQKTWPAVVDVGQLDGTNGAIFYGDQPNDAIGVAVSAAKDFNMDGIDDFMVSATGDGKSSSRGKVYLIFGHNGTWPSPSALITLNGKNGVIFRGEGPYDDFGRSIAPAHNVDGTDRPVIIVGAPGANATDAATSLGRTYLFYGHPGPFPAVVEAATGTIFVGAAEDRNSGNQVAALGDVNGDGLEDFIIGAPESSYGNNSAIGKAYVVFGSNETRPSTVSLADVVATQIVANISWSDLATAVAGVGDLDSDGFPEVAVGAPLGFSETGIGQIMFIYGHNGTWKKVITPESLDGSNGFIVDGMAPFDATGGSVASAGDFNGDGLPDAAIGVPGAAYVNGGAGFVLYGRARSGQRQVPVALILSLLGAAAIAGAAVGAALCIRRYKNRPKQGEEIALVPK